MFHVNLCFLVFEIGSCTDQTHLYSVALNCRFSPRPVLQPCAPILVYAVGGY